MQVKQNRKGRKPTGLEIFGGMTPAEVCEAAQVCRATLYNFIRRPNRKTSKAKTALLNLIESIQQKSQYHDQAS